MHLLELVHAFERQDDSTLHRHCATRPAGAGAAWSHECGVFRSRPHHAYDVGVRSHTDYGIGEARFSLAFVVGVRGQHVGVREDLIAANTPANFEQRTLGAGLCTHVRSTLPERTACVKARKDRGDAD
jgi:hypothetical protein